MKIRNALYTLLLLAYTPSWAADVPVPVATDSRIKTFVYSENDVFSVVTHYGYQSNIEFSSNEDIETISVGDRTGWQIVPAGRRIFIRALAMNIRTNMTVVTNKHAYQFDLVSAAKPISPREELVYVVRFFYPGDKANILPPASYTDDAQPAPAPYASSPPPSAMPAGAMMYNYNYTYTGDNAIAPVRLFDDGHATYFKFRGNEAPKILQVSKSMMTPLSVHKDGEYWVVNTVAERFVLQQGRATVCVYNEKLAPPH